MHSSKSDYPTGENSTVLAKYVAIWAASNTDSPSTLASDDISSSDKNSISESSESEIELRRTEGKMQEALKAERLD